MKMKFVILIVICTFLSGCAVHRNAAATETMAELQLIPTEIPTETIAPTQAPTEPTEPPVTLPPALDIPAGAHCLEFTDDTLNITMKYWLYVPENATQNMPLLIFLHGVGEIGRINQLENYGLMNNVYEIYGNEFPFLVLYPNTTVRSWSRESVTLKFKTLVDALVDEYHIDPEHIMLTGHSLGAIGTWHMISEFGDFFSVAVPVSSGSGEKLNYENLAKVPIRAFVGSREKSYTNEMLQIVTLALDAGADIELIKLDQCGHIETVTAPFTKDLFDWMLNQ